jgi:hypothetical protein
MCFDSRWIGLDYPTDYSNDGTDEIIHIFKRNFHTPIEYIKLPSPIHQYEARTLALRYVKTGDWVFVIDADEFIILWDNNIRSFLKTTTDKGFRICFKYAKPYSAYPTFRFVKKTEKMHYSYDHRRVFDCDGEVETKNFPALTSIVIDNHSLADEKVMRPFTKKYEDWLRTFEKKNSVKDNQNI